VLVPVAVACGGKVEDPNTEEGQQSASRAPEENATTPPEKKPDECALGDKRSCENRDVDGTQECTWDNTLRAVWGPCNVASGSSSTPLVLVFDGAPVTFSTATGAAFDVVGDGASHVTSWPTARTPWLALDRDGNGRIDDGSELFGSMTTLSTGVRAKNGFEALAELDSNHDGVISDEDESFGQLLIWADGRGRPASERIVRIELAYRRAPRCTASGDCEIERATFVYRGSDGREQTGEVVDVHLRYR